MALNLTILTNYTTPGEFFVGTNTNEHGNLKSVISKIEKRVLTDLIGAKYYNELQADLLAYQTANPSAISLKPTLRKYYDLVFGFTWIDQDDETIHHNYEGFLDMLRGFVFYHYVRDYAMKRTGTGIVEIIGENSSPTSKEYIGAYLRTKYNEAVQRYKNAQCVLEVFKNGYEHPFTLFEETGTPGTYQIDVDFTPPMIDQNDEIVLSEYPNETITVSTDITNGATVTDFEATATTGLANVTNSNFEFTAFEDYVTKEYEYNF